MNIELINERPSVRLVFLLWQKYKQHCETCWPSIETYLAMLDAFSTNHKIEWSDGRTFNNLFLNNESSIGYDGDSLKAILHFEVCEVLKQRLTRP